MRWLALAVLVAGVVAVPSALADDPQGQAESLGSGLVRRDERQPAAAGGTPTAIKAEKAAFRAEAKKAGVSFTERYAFDKLWNGLSIQTTVRRREASGHRGRQGGVSGADGAIPPTETADPDL